MRRLVPLANGNRDTRQRGRVESAGSALNAALSPRPTLDKAVAALPASRRRGRQLLITPSAVFARLHSRPQHAAAADVRDERRTAHALRHTFCTMLAERGVAMEVFRALAGHVDIRTTQIYVDVTDQRKAEGIAALERDRHPLAAP